MQKNQIEIDQKISADGLIEKKVKISTLCNVEWYENDGITKLVPVTGTAILKKGKGNAIVDKVVNVAIGIKQLKKGYELKPGIKSSSRRIKVNGGDVNDIPCQYSIVGLERYELPVVGEYLQSVRYNLLKLNCYFVLITPFLNQEPTLILALSLDFITE